jgi:hypothetical protein
MVFVAHDTPPIVVNAPHIKIGATDRESCKPAFTMPAGGRGNHLTPGPGSVSAVKAES